MNAVQAIDSNGEGSLTIRSRAEDDHNIIEIIDNGCGIRSCDLPRVFEPFFSTKRNEHNEGGLGLGLALTRALLQEHGGRISIQSTWGEGTCCTIHLPSCEGFRSPESEG